MTEVLPSRFDVIARLIRDDRHAEAEVAMAAYDDMTWVDWCALCQITFDHQDRGTPSLALPASAIEGGTEP